MEIVLVLLAIIGIAFYLLQKRKAKLGDLVNELLGQISRPQVATTERVVNSESVQDEIAAQPAETAVVEQQEIVENTGVAAEVQVAEVAPVVSTPVVAEEKIPEDSTLRRHYLSKRQAEREAITNPFPTDATLRRHYESMVTVVPSQTETVEVIENAVSAASESVISEDVVAGKPSMAQLQAYIEAQIGQRPTDSALSRHYDALLKAKMDELSA